jgi:hypothetical protein
LSDTERKREEVAATEMRAVEDEISLRRFFFNSVFLFNLGIASFAIRNCYFTFLCNGFVLVGLTSRWLINLIF